MVHDNIKEKNTNIAESLSEDSNNVGQLLMLLATKEKWNSKSLDKHTHSESSLVHCLQLLSACAESFPRGECWSSTNQWKCSKENMLQGQGNQNDKNAISYHNISTLEDIAIVVFSVGNLLEVHGGANGNQTIQFWSLVCLLKLTESSVMICRYWCRKKNRSAFSILASAWRSVWDTLFRSDLRYSSSTKSATPMSLGELVLLLLVEMIRNCCLDPNIVHTHLDNIQNSKNENKFDHGGSTTQSDRNVIQNSFLYSRQHQVWCLPIYKNPAVVRTSSPFELASTLI